MIRRHTYTDAEGNHVIETTYGVSRGTLFAVAFGLSVPALFLLALIVGQIVIYGGW